MFADQGHDVVALSLTGGPPPPPDADPKVRAVRNRLNHYRPRTSRILCIYAALFEPSIREVVVVAPPTSHAEGPAFLNVLRALDIPDALGLLAPRRLALVNADDSLFERTRAI